MNSHKIRLIGSLMFMAAACTGGNAFLFVDSILSPADQDRPAITRAVDGIPGWTRTGGPEMHRALAVRALSEGESLNTFVVKSLKKAVSGRPPEAGMPDGSQGK